MRERESAFILQKRPLKLVEKMEEEGGPNYGEYSYETCKILLIQGRQGDGVGARRLTNEGPSTEDVCTKVGLARKKI